MLKMEITLKKVKPGEGLGVCSPIAIDNYTKYSTCLSKDALVKIANAWNAEHPKDRITGINRKGSNALWTDINNKMTSLKYCEDKQEWCWVSKLHLQNDKAVSKFLRPKMPDEWYAKPNTWLSNWDIEKVMKQYDEARDRFHYKFMGVFPVDFAESSPFGTCISEEMCNLASQIPDLLKKGIKFIGLITNLDRHDESGSHWTSIFMCIDPELPAYGCYYYDSVSGPPPPEIAKFIKNLKEKLDPKKRFKILYSKKRHQYGSSECGVFSIIFQVRWLEKLEVNPKTTFVEIVDCNLKDEEMNKYYRHILFSPSQQ